MFWKKVVTTLFIKKGSEAAADTAISPTWTANASRNATEANAASSEGSSNVPVRRRQRRRCRTGLSTNVDPGQCFLTQVSPPRFQTADVHPTGTRQLKMQNGTTSGQLNISTLSGGVRIRAKTTN